MARICYCVRCDEGERELLSKLEEYNGLADVHFVSKTDPRWTSFEWTGLFFMGPEALVGRVMERKKQEFGTPPADLQIHTCEQES